MIVMLKVKKAVNQWGMRLLMEALEKIKKLVTITRVKEMMETPPKPSSLLSHAHTTEEREMCFLSQKGKGPSLFQLFSPRTKARKIWTEVSNR